ncbi:hypothetical protein PIB30_069443 [Stylosanthes scabra]|uniref:Uncharacterized protein n=1 Tax=Stylosanthes scabra TaxID=79078 RepID=A0ABU6YQU8_9FABA|nr:hypothetical protein [Stylosanthes scabra]
MTPRRLEFLQEFKSSAVLNGELGMSIYNAFASEDDDEATAMILEKGAWALVVKVWEGGRVTVGRPGAQNWRLGVVDEKKKGVPGLKPVVHYRLLYIDAKPRMLAFKCSWKHLIWSYVTRVIPFLVQRGHAGKLTKTHGRLGIKVERLGAHFFASRAQNQRLGIQGWCLGVGVGGK